jgi:hypothetical protein
MRRFELHGALLYEESLRYAPFAWFTSPAVYRQHYITSLHKYAVTETGGSQRLQDEP